MKTVKNNFWRLILLGLALAGSLASAAFGMNQDGVSAPDLSSIPAVAAPAAFAEQVVTIISNDGMKYRLPLNMLAMPFRGNAALSQVLYNMFQDYKKTFDAMVGAPDNKEGTLIADELFKLNFAIEETQINLKSDILVKVIAIFTHLYQAKTNNTNIEDEANYFQMLDRESADIFTGLPTQDKRKLLFELYAVADYLESQVLYDLCERQFLTTDTIEDFRVNPQAYTNQWLLAVRQLSVTAGTGLFKAAQTLQGHERDVRSVTISTNGKTIVSGSNNHTIKVLTKDPVTHLFAESQILQGHNDWVNSVAISTNGNTIISGSEDTTIKVWTKNQETHLFAESQTLQGHNSAVLSVALSPDGNTIISGSHDSTIKVWNKDPVTHLFAESQTLQGHNDSVFSVALSPDGTTIVSGSRDSTIKIWTKNSATHLFAESQTLQGHRGSVFSVALSPDGNTIVSGSVNRTIKVWIRDLATLLFAESQTLQGHNDPVFSNDSVFSVALSPDGNTIVSGLTDRTIKVWTKDPITHRFAESQTLQGHKNSVRSVALSPDGNAIISGSRDSTIKVWQRDYFSGTVSLQQAMFLETINQAPNHILDLTAATEANKILRKVAASFNGNQANEYVRNHVLIPTGLSRITSFVRTHPIATVAAVGSAIGFGYATRKLWRKLF